MANTMKALRALQQISPSLSNILSGNCENFGGTNTYARKQSAAITHDDTLIEGSNTIFGGGNSGVAN